MLAARAEGVGSCLTALLQFFHPTETFEILGVPSDDGWILSGTVSFGYPTGTWAVGDAGPGPRGLVPQHLGHRGRLRGARTPVAGLTELAVPFAGTVLRVGRGPRRPRGRRGRPRRARVDEDGARRGGRTLGRIDSVAVAPGDAVQTGDVLLSIEEDERRGRRAVDGAARLVGRPTKDPSRARRAARPGRGHPRRGPTGGDRAPARRRATDGTGEHRGPVRPRQLRGVRRPRHRRPAGAAASTEDLVANTPGRRPDRRASAGSTVTSSTPERSRCAVLSYDYSVLAGTQGQMNHRKKDRLFELVERLRLPVVLFAEGGGGRPGDTDMAVVTGLDTEAFARFGALSGLVPLGRRGVGPLLRRQRRAARLLPRRSSPRPTPPSGWEARP